MKGKERVNGGLRGLEANFRHKPWMTWSHELEESKEMGQTINLVIEQ